METTTQVSSLREPGAILLISCYELGHQPIGIAQPCGFLEQAGYVPTGMDIAVEDFDEEGVRRARFVGISVPMHTALRLGTRVAEKVRSMNPSCHICFYGLYASLNGEYLLRHVADSVIGGEYEIPLVALVEALERAHSAARNGAGEIGPLEGVSTRSHSVPPVLRRLPSSIPVPSRRSLPVLDRYARLDRDGELGLVGYVEASRGCLHHCLHCPIVPVYEGRFVLVPEDSVLEDIRRLVAAGATHITFGDPDFLNGPGHSMEIVRAMHDEFPQLTFDFTAKIEHLLKRRALLPDFASMGCLFVISAAESFSDTVLTRLQKGHTGE
ncbi:MAG: CUAEP/CCAEP-tail radical SAM protein, partial [Nitrospiraceae bacterium]